MAKPGTAGPASGNGKGPRAAPTPPRDEARRWVIPVVAVAVVVLAAAVAIGASALGSKSGKGAATPQRAPVTVTGAALPPSPEQGTDTAIGQPVPALDGTGLDGAPIQVPAAGGPKLVMFIAHWCPHCQKEVPLLSDWLPANTPDGVALYSVATATDSTRPNYPPSDWLAREGWPVRTMADSAEDTAGRAYGVTGYPTFVAVDANGTVVGRRSGELSTDEVRALLDAAKSGTPT